MTGHAHGSTPAPARHEVSAGRLIAVFDMVAFSLSFENDYPAVLTVLERAAIPLVRDRRDDTYPLIIAGGVCAFLNPEPLADFIDLFIIGEGEEVLPRLIAAYRDLTEQGTARETMLAELAQIDGIYVPALYEVRYHPSGTIASFAPRENAPPRIRRAVTASLDRYPAHSAVITPFTEFSSMFLMEVSRGCPYGCNFCCLGSVYRPVRRRSIGGRAGSSGEPCYVARKDRAHNALVVVQGRDHPLLWSKALIAARPRWISAPPVRLAQGEPARLHARTRHRHTLAACSVRSTVDDRLAVAFDEPQWAVTPGQYVVLYDGEECLGGAVIEGDPL